MKGGDLLINEQADLVEAFHYAIGRDHINNVRQHLARHPDLINWEDDTWNKGFTPIMSALLISPSNPSVFNYLIQNDKIDLTVLNKDKESVLFLAINLQIDGVIEQILQANPELLFSKYKGIRVNTDLNGYSPTRYVRTLYDRVNTSGRPTGLSMKYVRIIDILDNFYTDYETYYLRGDDEMPITRTGEFTQNRQRRRQTRRRIANIFTRRRRRWPRSAGRPRVARTPSTRSRRSSGRSSPSARSRRSSGRSSPSARSRRSSGRSSPSASSRSSRRSSASGRSSASSRSSRRSSASGRSSASSRSSRRSSASGRSRSGSSQASTDSFDSGASFTSSQIDELTPEQYSRVYANMTGR
jgi:hypothetical protein